MRVAVIGSRGVPAAYSGIERHVEEIGARVAAEGHQVVVFCRGRSGPDGYRGMHLRYSPSVSTKHLETISHTAVVALRATRGFDLVHFHAVGPCLLSPLNRATSPGAVVATVHGRDSERAKWSWPARSALRMGEWMSASVPQATIVVSAALQRHFRQAYRRDTVLIRNGVAVPARVVDAAARLAKLGLRPSGYVLFVGRLVPEKAPHLILEAFRQVATESQVVVVGGSAHTDRYVARLRSAAADDPRVVLAGPLFGNDLAALYQEAAVFVSPSLLEGAPLTVLEAAGSGVPLVLSDIPEHLEDFPVDGPGHRLVKRGDVAALSAALQSVLDNLAIERAAAGQLPARVARMHDWDRAAEETLRVYGRVLGTRR